MEEFTCSCKNLGHRAHPEWGVFRGREGLPEVDKFASKPRLIILDNVSSRGLDKGKEKTDAFI